MELPFSHSFIIFTPSEILGRSVYWISHLWYLFWHVVKKMTVNYTKAYAQWNWSVIWLSIIFLLRTQVQVFCCLTSTRYISSFCCHTVSSETRLTVNRGTELPGINTVRKFPTASYLTYSNLANIRYEILCQYLTHERQKIVKYCDLNNQNDTKASIVVRWVAQSFSNEFLGFKAMIPALSLVYC